MHGGRGKTRMEADSHLAEANVSSGELWGMNGLMCELSLLRPGSLCPSILGSHWLGVLVGG